jgi:hypothetical protein
MIERLLDVTKVSASVRVKESTNFHYDLTWGVFQIRGIANVVTSNAREPNEERDDARPSLHYVHTFQITPLRSRLRGASCRRSNAVPPSMLSIIDCGIERVPYSQSCVCSMR